MKCPKCGYTTEEKEERLLSMTVVKSSGLPETLHHSIRSFYGAWKRLTPKEFMRKYHERKVALGDQVMLDLLFIYSDKVKRYLDELLTTTK